MTNRRPADYSPEEDAIVIATSGESTAETNRRLRNAGFPERTPASIKQRRYYLRQTQPKTVRVLEQEDDEDKHELLAELLRRRKGYSQELDRLHREEQNVRAAIAEVNAELAKFRGWLTEVIEDPTLGGAAEA